ncbi:MAG TPA: hypothetical protein VLF39_01655 [Candidatus Saccharimonadales bacterium]|nr:hypothetical protein [Candidatus Saccharimonadales bacterium]
MLNRNKLLAIVSWLLPSGSGVIIYFLTSVLTLSLSNANYFRSFFDLPQNFHFKNALLDSINNLVQRFVGDHIARSAIVALFWALVGLLVYMVIWVMINYSDEIGNDLAVTKYMHPRNSDTRSPLRGLIVRIAFQVIALIILIIYLNMVINVIIPRIGNLYRQSIHQWPSLQSVGHGSLGLLCEFVALHLIILLARLLTLRKRIFG